MSVEKDLLQKLGIEGRLRVSFKLRRLALKIAENMIRNQQPNIGEAELKKELMKRILLPGLS